MTKTVTILKTMQALSLITALTPASSFAESTPTARQMLAQAQIQSQKEAVKGEINKIFSRALSLGTKESAISDKPAASVIAANALSDGPASTAPVQPVQVETADLNVPKSQSVDVAVLADAAQPFRVVTVSAMSATEPQPVPSEIVTQPRIAAGDSVTVVATNTVAPSVSAPISLMTPAAPAPSSNSAARSVEAAKDLAPTFDRDRAGASTTKTAATTKAAISKKSDQVPHLRHTRTRDNAGVQVGGVSIDRANVARFNVGGQLQKIISRPELRSILAQYGLD
jgi:hypothetical protein